MASEAGYPKAADRWMGVAQILCVLFFPWLWFFERIPDSKELPHLTWHWGWLFLPIILGGIKLFRRESARDAGAEIPPATKQAALGAKISLAVMTPFLAVLAANGVLELRGYNRELPTIEFKTREPNDKVEADRVLNHPVLLFTFNPGTIYNAVEINSLGYREREVNPEKAPGSKRVICLGDSITAQGRPNYSGLLHERLQEEAPSEQPWEAFNMGVYGYSSRQGLAVFRLQAKPLKPDYITVYFGPNDRLLHGQMDKHRMSKTASGATKALLENFQEKPLGQYIIGKSRDLALKRQEDLGVEGKVIRVPHDDYRHVLRRFVLEAREIDAEAILLTAPRRELSPGLLSRGFAISVENQEKRHDEYNEIVREVAAELDAPLLDLAKLMEGDSFDHMFADDGIHFDSYSTEHVAKPETQPGLEFIAEQLHQLIVELEQ